MDVCDDPPLHITFRSGAKGKVVCRLGPFLQKPRGASHAPRIEAYDIGVRRVPAVNDEDVLTIPTDCAGIAIGRPE
jgi:hypothetical protein